MHEALSTSINYIQLHWEALSAIIGGGAGLSVACEFILEKFHVDSKKLAYSLIHLLSLAAAATDYLIQNHNVLPAYAGLAIAAQTVHRFLLSPFMTKYGSPFLQMISKQKSQPTQPPEPPAPSDAPQLT